MCENTEVNEIEPTPEGFRVYADGGSVRAKHVIWAVGNFSIRGGTVSGVEHCAHRNDNSYKRLDGDDFIIVGGYESGIDAAYHLATRANGPRSLIKNCPLKDAISEPSLALSPYSRERMKSHQFVENVETYPNTAIASVERSERGYTVVTEDGQRFQTQVPPLLAHGFEGSHKLISGMF